MSKNDYVRVLDTSLVVLPFAEGFEEIESFENGQSPVWYTENENGTNAWEITNQAAFSGTHSAMINGMESYVGEKINLLSQTFDMTYLGSSNARLTFKYATKRRNSASADKLLVYVSRNCGKDWIVRKTLEDDELYTVAGIQSTPFYPENENQWAEVEINNIVPVFFTPEFRLKFEFVSAYSNNIFIDDINLTDASTVSVISLESIQGSVSIFPNPARDIVKIEMDVPTGSSNIEINLHDISGRLIRNVHSGKTTGGKNLFEISVNQLTGGFYFLQFTTDEGHFVKKFAVSK